MVRAGDKSPQHNRPDGRTPRGGEADATHRKVEIVHESLLTAWPRLVRWQTQDIEGAQLRDELRQAAQMWDQHGRSEDLLWTGTAFREFQLWREHYPGGLSAQEEAFGSAMTAHAERRRRRRQLAVGVVVGLALLVALVTGALWQRSEAEARRAVASELVALAQLRIDEDLTEALAYATASLELADSEAARLFVARVRWTGPPALEAYDRDLSVQRPSFNPDGSRIAASGYSDKAWVWEETGGQPVVLPGQEVIGENLITDWFSNDLLVTAFNGGQVAHLWSFPGAKLVRAIDFGGPAFPLVGKTHLFAEVVETDPETGHEIFNLRAWRLPDGEQEDLGSFDGTALGHSNGWFDPDGSGWVYAKGNQIFYRPLPIRESIADRLVGSHEERVRFVERPVEPDRVWTSDVATSELILWDLSRPDAEPVRVIERPTQMEEGAPFDLPDPAGRWVSSTDRGVRVWDTQAWLASRPLTLRRSGTWFAAWTRFHPRGSWAAVATHGYTRLTFWPLGDVWPTVVDGYSASFMRPLAFSADGRWLATVWLDTSIRLWPLPGSGLQEVVTLPLPVVALGWRDLVFDPRGRYLLAVAQQNGVYIVPLDGSPPIRVEELSSLRFPSDGAVSPSGRQIATAFRIDPEEEIDRTLRIWNVETGELKRFDLPHTENATFDFAGGVWDIGFADESTVYTSGDGGIYRWNLETGVHELVLATQPGRGRTWTAFPDRDTAFVLEPEPGGESLGPARAVDLATGESRELSAFAGDALRSPQLWPRNAFGASGTAAVTGDPDGVIRVAPLSGGEPHLLFGHEGVVDFIAVSPDGRWIASSGEDDTLRLWPMPDLSRPPLHSLPRAELITKLKSMTNIRAVRDPESPDGWKVTLDPFPGWAEVPTW